MEKVKRFWFVLELTRNRENVAIADGWRMGEDLCAYIRRTWWTRDIIGFKVFPSRLQAERYACERNECYKANGTLCGE